MKDNKLRILVVDDLEDWQKTLGGLLRDEGYQVETAGSMEDALALLEAGRFALAVLDMRLDETNEQDTRGLDLAREISKRWPGVKTIILTGYGTLETIRAAMEPHPTFGGLRLVFNFIPKTESKKLAETVEKALSQDIGAQDA